MTDEELARVTTKSEEVARGSHQGYADRVWWREMAVRLAAEVRYLRAVSGAWKLLASALILYRGRGNESDVLQAVANLDKLGVKVP